MYIFNTLLQRHNDSQPKFFLQKESIVKDTKEKPSLSYSDTSTRSVDPGKESSFALSTTPTITNKISSENTDRSYSRSIFSNSQQYSQDIMTKNLSSQCVRSKQHERDFSRTKVEPRIIDSTQSSTSKSSMAKKLPSFPSPRLQQLPRTTSYSVNGSNPTALPPSLSAQRALERLKNIIFKDSAPSVSQAPTAILGSGSTRTSAEHKHKQKHHTGSKSAHSSMAKTIAEQTPNAFQTLGPGFNTNAASANRSSNLLSSSLGSFSVPSDYEHIYHAPSQISDLPSNKELTKSRQASSQRSTSSGSHNHRSRKKVD